MKIPHTCAGCRYWSEILTQSGGGGFVRAMCLVSEDDRLRGDAIRSYAGTYTSGWQTCLFWASGELGSIDEPGCDPDRYSTDAVGRVVKRKPS